MIYLGIGLVSAAALYSVVYLTLRNRCKHCHKKAVDCSPSRGQFKDVWCSPCEEKRKRLPK